MAVTLLLGSGHFGLLLDDAIVFGLCFGGGAAVLLADFFLLPWPAMVEGLRGKHQYRSVLSALMRGLAASLLALFCFSVTCLGDIRTIVIVPTFFWLWVIASTVWVLTVALSREKELRERFLSLATGDNHCRAVPLPGAPSVTLRTQATPPLAEAARG